MKRNHTIGGAIFTTTALLALIAANNVHLYAHGILSKETGPGKVGFTYDDGAAVTQGHVVVEDKDGKEIATGRTDADGVFDYSSYENIGKIVVADTHGHRQSHVPGDDRPGHSADHHHEHPHDQLGNAPVVVGVTILLVAVAAVFYLMNRKKKGASSDPS